MTHYSEPNNRVNVGIIGLGSRGIATLKRFLILDDVFVSAIADINPDNIEQAEILTSQSGQQTTSFVGYDAASKLLHSSNIDLVIIATDWSSHASLAIQAMQAGKDVAVEVPLAVSIEQGLEIIKTAESTSRKCFMMENCCYDPFALNTLHQANKGTFGSLTHCEGAYIHQLYSADGTQTSGKAASWMTSSCAASGGNPYPTHGLGPICQLFDIGKTDHLDYLVSMSTTGSGGLPINTTLIHTTLGRCITLQFDISTPRPYSRIQLVCGTDGFIRKYPTPIMQTAQSEAIYGDDVWNFLDADPHPWIAKYKPDALRLGVDNLMNYIMDRRIIHCMMHRLPFDISVNEAVLWSAIAPLSAVSAASGSRPVAIPRF